MNNKNQQQLNQEAARIDDTVAALAPATGSAVPERCRVQLVRQSFKVQIGMGKYRSEISVMNDRRDVLAVLAAALDRSMDFLQVTVETRPVEWPTDWPKLDPPNSERSDPAQ